MTTPLPPQHPTSPPPAPTPLSAEGLSAAESFQAFFEPTWRRVLGIVAVLAVSGAYGLAVASQPAPADPEVELWQTGWYPTYAGAIELHRESGDCFELQRLFDALEANSSEHMERFGVGLVPVMGRTHDTMDEIGCFG